MDNNTYPFTPMKKTQSVPVNWKFTQSDYDKLTKGHRSHWNIFMRGDTVHFCRAGGEEFYRFKVIKTDNDYHTDNLEIYIPDDFYESAKLHKWTDVKIKQHQAELRQMAIEETTGLLANYFDITKSP